MFTLPVHEASYCSRRHQLRAVYYQTETTNMFELCDVDDALFYAED